MINKIIIGIIVLAVIGAVIGGLVKYTREAAVSEERRDRMADAIELIRDTDKKLDVVRKATDADLCRELGGKTVDGVCQ